MKNLKNKKNIIKKKFSKMKQLVFKREGKKYVRDKLYLTKKFFNKIKLNKIIKQMIAK